MKLRCVSLALALVAASSSAAQNTTENAMIEVSGLRAPAEILIDRWGVPHIYAQNADDAFFVQGFNAARDRLFQIDLWRRRGLGLLSEMLGPTYVEQDRAARLFLYRGDMNKEWNAYGADAERIATSFVAGINSYIDWLASHPEAMPVEFKVLGATPAKWRPEDVVRIRSHGLTRNLVSEVARANTVCKTGRENGLKYDAVRVGLEPEWETTIPAGLDPCLPDDVLKVFSLATRGVSIVKDAVLANAGLPFNDHLSSDHVEGSNNWVIAPGKSATGRPILANDPHRGYSTPSLRYIAHLHAPGMNVIGAGEPALPGISIGHNGTIAFGLTIFNIDQEDLYAYELDGDAERYRYRNGFERMRVIRETIPVKGGAPVPVELAFTRHGPVIYSDGTRAYAVRSCWLEPGMAPYFGSVSYMRAKNFAEFKRAMLRWGAPTENQVYADVQGNVGWVPGGLAPIRPNWDGLMPVPGDGRYEWKGFWRGDRLPSAFNPADGYITTSNEMNLPADYPYRERKLGFEWTNSSRHERIDEVLRALPKVSLEQSMQLQNDLLSIPARRLIKLLAPLSSDDANTHAALQLFKGWDAVERAESPQAALLAVWLSRHLGNAFLSEIMPEHAADVVGSPDIAVMLRTLENPNAGFTADRRAQVLLSSLGAAYADTQALLGEDSKLWQWGHLHQSLPEHVLAAVVDDKLRAQLQPGPFPVGGSPYTPLQSVYRQSDFRLTNGPSFRMVLDVGNWDRSRAVNYPGQSGNPYDAHYSDLAPMWLRGEYFPLLYSRDEVEKAAQSSIQLRPAHLASAKRRGE